MPAHPSEPAPGDLCVLLVEDDAITARYVRDCLCDAGYPPPAVAANAEEALSLASTAWPDLVLMDIALRGEMDGVEAAGRIRETTGAEVVFITAFSDEATRRRAMEAGATGYLVKPFLKQELCATVGQALHRPGVRSAPIPDLLPPLNVEDTLEKLCALADELRHQNEELARTQQRAEEERQRYRSLFDLAPDGYLVTDRTGVIREASRGAAELLGVNPAQLAGKPLSLFVPHGGHEDYYEQLGHLERDPGRRQWETPLRPRGREPFDAALTILPIQDAEGHPTAVHWMIRDISAHTAAERALREARDTLEARVRERTAELMRLDVALQSEVAERQRAEESLDESRRLLQSITDAAPCALYAYDLRERSTIYANAYLAGCLGYPHDEAQAPALDSSMALVHPDDYGSAERHMELLRHAADGEVIESTLRLRHHDGTWRWMRFRDVVSSRATSDAPVQYVGAAMDVTDQRAAQEALVRAERLVEVGRLAASLAHEINNPLQGVLGCLSLLEEALAEGRDASRYLEVAQSEVHRAVRVVGQLRDLGRQARAPVERVATGVGKVVSRVMAAVEKRCIDQGIQLVYEPSEAVPEVMIDPDAIQQVFLNLALNALDVMPDGGSLRLAATATTAPDGVCITFADDGPGIAPEVLPKLFDSFVTTKPDGLGLGLYISRNIVEQHGGRIEVDTHPGAGTTFAVWLPTRAAHPRNASPQAPHSD